MKTGAWLRASFSISERTCTIAGDSPVRLECLCCRGCRRHPGRHREHRLDQRPQLVDGTGLEIVEGPGLEGRDRVVHAAEGGDHRHRQITARFRRCSAPARAVAIGQAHVGEAQAVALLAEQRRASARWRRHRWQAEAQQAQFEQLRMSSSSSTMSTSGRWSGPVFRSGSWFDASDDRKWAPGLQWCRLSAGGVSTVRAPRRWLRRVPARCRARGRCLSRVVKKGSKPAPADLGNPRPSSDTSSATRPSSRSAASILPQPARRCNADGHCRPDSTKSAAGWVRSMAISSPGGTD